MSYILTKKEIIDVLLDWQAEKMSVVDVQKWADKHFLDDNCTYENDDDAIIEVITNLGSAHLNLVVREDIPTYIQFLNASDDDFEEAYEELVEYHRSIDYEKRISQIKDEPFYQKGCQIKIFPAY